MRQGKSCQTKYHFTDLRTCHGRGVLLHAAPSPLDLRSRPCQGALHKGYISSFPPSGPRGSYSGRQSLACSRCPTRVCQTNRCVDDGCPRSCSFLYSHIRNPSARSLLRPCLPGAGPAVSKAGMPSGSSFLLGETGQEYVHSHKRSPEHAAVK